MKAHIALGLNRNKALAIIGLTKHLYYHKPSRGKRGIKPSEQVVRHKHGGKRTCSNSAVVRYMQRIQMNDVTCDVAIDLRQISYKSKAVRLIIKRCIGLCKNIIYCFPNKRGQNVIMSSTSGDYPKFCV